MSTVAKVKQLHLIQRNFRWWNSDLSTSVKIAYYGSMAVSLPRVAITGKKSVKYLGKKMHYDNFATPLTLQYYPHEITKSILENVDSLPIKRVLDIGGNIGQFSLTLSYALKDLVQIDVLEPNSVIYELLCRNTSHKSNIRPYNYGVGRPNTKQLYYTPGRSGMGSIYKENAGTTKNVRKTKISLTNDISSVTGHGIYDLTKIDVEGYEYSLIEAVKPFKTRLLFIEVSGLGRYKNFSHSQLFAAIEKKFGKFDILHSSGSNSKSNNFDALLQFMKK